MGRPRGGLGGGPAEDLAGFDVKGGRGNALEINAPPALSAIVEAGHRAVDTAGKSGSAVPGTSFSAEPSTLAASVVVWGMVARLRSRGRAGRGATASMAARCFRSKKACCRSTNEVFKEPMIFRVLVLSSG